MERERDLLTGHFYVSLNTYLFIFPSESPVREPPPCSLTGSPWTGIHHHQSHWSIHSFIHVCLLESPERSPPAYGEKHKVTFHGAPHRQKFYIQQGMAWFPNDTAISTPVQTLQAIASHYTDWAIPAQVYVPYRHKNKAVILTDKYG